VSRDEYDMVVSREILIELVEKWNDAEYLNRRCALDGKTAMHLLIEAGNVEAVRLLLEWVADRMVRDANALTPLKYAIALQTDEESHSGRKIELQAIVSLLEQ